MILDNLQLRALTNLRLGNDFTIEDNDLTTIKWLNDETIVTPTIEEINDYISSEQMLVNQNKEIRLQVLNRLGITEEEAKLLLS